MNKQDILNAFREKFVPSFGLDDNYTYYGGCPDRAVLEQWLLNTLTEFERGTKERIKLCAKEQSCSMCMESLSQLEKEKHT